MTYKTYKKNIISAAQLDGDKKKKQDSRTIKT